MMKIGYVCTNYNNSSFTLGAVRSLAASNGPHQFHVVVVDNNSWPDQLTELQAIRDEFAFVEIVASETNHGYFRGLNLGIKKIRNDHPDIEWLVVGNNDLVFPPDFADKLAANAARFRPHAVVSPDVITVEGEHQNPHVISGISRARELVYDLYYSNYYMGMAVRKVARLLPRLSERSDELEWRTPRPIYQGHGSCYLLGPRFFELFTELWAPTFLMFEEFFLSKQLADAGLQVYYDPAVQVMHHWHGSLEKLPSRQRWNLEKEASREYRKHIKPWRWEFPLL